MSTQMQMMVIIMMTIMMNNDKNGNVDGNNDDWDDFNDNSQLMLCLNLPWLYLGEIFPWQNI
jgi:hypothetical protein